MPKKEVKDYSTLPALKSHPLYALLTAKQQIFLTAYLETGDRLEAVKRAGLGLSRPDVSAMRLLRTAYIRNLIAIYHGYDIDQAPMGKNELRGLIAARLRSQATRDSDFWRLVDLMMELMFHGKRVDRHQNRKPDLIRVGRPTNEEKEGYALTAAQELDALVKQIESERKQSSQS